MGFPGYKAKRMLGLCCSWSGLAAARWRLLPPGIYILNYHRIGNPASTAFDRGTFSCSLSRFRLHLETICERFKVINLDRLAHIVAKGALPTKKPIAVITFDDGYADNYSLAFPLLKEFSFTAAFFLPTSFINADHIPWWDEIAWHVRQSSHCRLSLPGLSSPLELEVANRDRVVRAVLQWARKHNQPMSEKLQMVREATGTIATWDAGKHSLFLSWSQAREMARAGMDIGSHTHSHGILSHLTETAQTHEFVESRRILEDELGERVISIAYPVGDATCFTSRTLELARLAGYQLGFNYLGRVQRVPVADPLNMHRLRVDDLGFSHSSLRELITFPNLAFD
jgi:peptidoglycan/xylan/chitin deacetylase (PgdA/CDA1 family)